MEESKTMPPWHPGEDFATESTEDTEKMGIWGREEE